MKFWKKLKRSIQQKSEMTRQQQIRKKYGDSGLARQCMQCKHFVFREEKPRNWVCRCPDEELRFVGTTCMGFKFGEHPEMIVFSSR